MNGSLGALLQEALADEERRLEQLEARLAALRGQQPAAPAPAPAPTAAPSDSTQAIWASLAVGPGRSPTAALAPAPAPPAPAPMQLAPEPAHGEEDADDWAALASPERVVTEPSATAYAAAAAAVEDVGVSPAGGDPRLEAARRLLLESGQGLQELKAVLARVPGWDDGAPAPPKAPRPPRPAKAPKAAPPPPPPEDEPAEEPEEFWSPPTTAAAEEEAPAPPPEVPARERPTRTRAGDASLFGLDRAFRGDAPAPTEGAEPAWARDLRERQQRGDEVLGRVEELLLELGKTIATVLERARGGDTAGLEARAERAERECEALRRAVAERATRIARLEALVEQVMVGAPAVPAPPPPPPPPPMLTPRGTRRPSSASIGGPGPSEALRRTLLGSNPSRSGEASRRALQALEQVTEDPDRVRLRQALVAIGHRHRELVDEHAALLDRLVRLLDS